MDWATTDKVEEDRRKKQTKKYTKMGLETIKRLAGWVYFFSVSASVTR